MRERGSATPIGDGVGDGPPGSVPRAAEPYPVTVIR